MGQMVKREANGHQFLKVYCLQGRLGKLASFNETVHQLVS